MPRTASEIETALLEARVPVYVYEQVKRAVLEAVIEALPTKGPVPSRQADTAYAADQSAA